MRAGTKVTKDQQTHWRTLRKGKGTTSNAAASSVDGGAAPMAAASSVDGEKPKVKAKQADGGKILDVPSPDIHDPDGDSVEDIMVTLDLDYLSMADQIGFLKMLANKLTVDSQLKDAEIARLNGLLSTREV